VRDVLVSRILPSVPFMALIVCRILTALQIGVSEIFQTRTQSPTGFSLKSSPLSLAVHWPDLPDDGAFETMSEVVSLPMAAILSLLFVASSIFNLSWPGLLVFMLIVDIVPVYFLWKVTQAQKKFFVSLVLYGLSTTPLLLQLGPDLTGSILLFATASLVLSLSVRSFGWASLACLLLVATDPVLGILMVASLLVLLVRMGLKVRDWLFLLSGAVIYALISLVFFAFFSDSHDASFELPVWEFVIRSNVDFGSGSLSVILISAVLCLGALMRIKRVNERLVSFAACSLVFIISLFPGAPPTWSLAIVPLLIWLFLRLTFWRAFAGIVAINLQGWMFIIKVFASSTSVFISDVFLVAYQTLSITLGMLALALVWRSEVINSDFLRLRSRPALVLIAGDSGVGKDTLAEGLSRSLGTDATILVSGDDYHVWDRGKASWNFVTHLNPSANELSRFAQDVMRLTEGRSIETGTYDHKLGRRLTSKTARSREFVIASGLHALWARDLNQLAALKIFISMSDDLRTLLKTNRDSVHRGYLKSEVLDVLMRRKADSENFIAPQRHEADLAIHLESDTSYSIEDSLASKMLFSSKPMLFDENLVSELSNTCGLEVIWESEEATRVISVSGNCDIDSLRHAFARLEPEVSSVLGPDIDFDKGGAGVIQMVVLVYLVSALRLERLI